MGDTKQNLTFFCLLFYFMTFHNLLLKQFFSECIGSFTKEI